MSLSQKYYRVLGINPFASLDEIEDAYKLRAKFLHPQNNQSPLAIDEYTELVLAYRYLTELRKRNTPETDIDFERWWQQTQPKTEEAAMHMAYKSYEEATDPEDFKTNNALNVIWRYILVAFFIGIIGAFTVIAVYYDAPVGFIVLALFLAITAPVLWHLIKSLTTYDYSPAVLAQSVKVIITSNWFIVGTLTLYNIVVFCSVVLNTMLQPINFLVLFGVIPLIAYTYLQFFGKQLKVYTKKLTVSLVYIPAFFASIFLINAIGIGQTTTETYRYSYTHDSHTITLKNNVYNEYWGMRFFIGNQTHSANTITYTIKEGIFGARVVSDYTTKLVFYEE